MFIASKRNIILPSPDGKRHFRVSRDYVGEIPDWASETDYFCALVKDGKISVPESHSDADVEKAGKRGRRGRKGQENGESSGEAETGKSKTGEAETNEAECRKGQENGESSGEAETGKSKTGEAETNEAE